MDGKSHLLRDAVGNVASLVRPWIPISSLNRGVGAQAQQPFQPTRQREATARDPLETLPVSRPRARGLEQVLNSPVVVKCHVEKSDLTGGAIVTAETATRARRPKEETARLGDEIYRRDVKAQVGSRATMEEYVAIDVDRRALGGRRPASLPHRTVSLAHCPNAIDVWLLRVGYRAVASIGGRVSAERRLIQGSVNAAYEAVVSLPLRGPAGHRGRGGHRFYPFPSRCRRRWSRSWDWAIEASIA